MYNVIRTILFIFSPERAHKLSLSALQWMNRLNLLNLLFGRTQSLPTTVMGITFPNPIGLAAGLDKNGDYINALSACGFGFIEIGTITPIAQPGNPKPRLFRLESDAAIINRMGFNNKGVEYLIERIKNSNPKCILGVNIGKNKITKNEEATSDYLKCFRKVYPYADYITINISSPNTPGLRDLQHGKALDDLLFQLKQEQTELNLTSGRYVPIVVKIAPDLNEEAIGSLAQTFIKSQVDGVIATNTTNQRPETLISKECKELGGLSGAPLTDSSNDVLELLCKKLQGQIPVIASGGVMTAEDVKRKIELGASLVQLYTGFVYNGPRLVRTSIRALL